MSEATNEPLSRLHIDAEKKTRRRGGPKILLVIVALVFLVAVVMGVLGGLLPARLAARKPVLDALRAV